MIGFIVGTVCVIGLVRVARRMAFHRGAFGCSGHGFHDVYRRSGPGGFGARNWFLRSLFERLETTPGQERVIIGALRELYDSRAAVRDELRQTRAEIAAVIAGGLVDDASLEDSFARHDRLLAQVRVSFVEALRKVTESLEEGQRKRLADILRGGRWGFGRGAGWSGGYDSVWA